MINHSIALGLVDSSAYCINWTYLALMRATLLLLLKKVLESLFKIQQIKISTSLTLSSMMYLDIGIALVLVDSSMYGEVHA